MTEVEVTCRLDDRSRVESRSHVDRRYDVVTAMTAEHIRHFPPILTRFARFQSSSSGCYGPDRYTAWVSILFNYGHPHNVICLFKPIP